MFTAYSKYGTYIGHWVPSELHLATALQTTRQIHRTREQNPVKTITLLRMQPTTLNSLTEVEVNYFQAAIQLTAPKQPEDDDPNTDIYQTEILRAQS
ncbi:hypothetical protein V1514DRAFT_321860 [Lipomyces japonicus]|uniref:uncharacterized protein n=1 Tax=Lipomyces japonicus TaxID=56871 RepID=UPI0034CDF5C4